MRIVFERSGGFAGMRISATIDTQALSPEQASELRSLIEAAHFFDLPKTIRSSTPGGDQFQYQVTIEGEGKRHTIEVNDASAPASLQPLLRQLTRLARSTGGS